MATSLLRGGRTAGLSLADEYLAAGDAIIRLRAARVRGCVNCNA
jgi:hypothetical protein